MGERRLRPVLRIGVSLFKLAQVCSPPAVLRRELRILFASVGPSRKRVCVLMWFSAGWWLAGNAFELECQDFLQRVWLMDAVGAAAKLFEKVNPSAAMELLKCQDEFGCV